MPNDSVEPKSEDSGLIKCPKCGHEFYCDPSWQKASITIGCPKCSAVIRVNEPKPNSS